MAGHLAAPPVMNIRRILYPTDFSACARAAFPAAASLARRHDAELHLFHATAPFAAEAYDPLFYLPDPEEAQAAAAAAATRELEALRGSREAAGLRVVLAQRQVMLPAPGILEYATEERADLVVMGTHGRRGPARLLLGSVAEEVLHGAVCPVLAIRAPDNGEPPLRVVRRVVVPFDFSPPARRALRAAADLARRLPAALTLLHVVEEPPRPALHGAGGAAEAAALRNRALVEAERELREAAAELAPGLECEVEVCSGRPATEIVGFSSRPGIDLVVIASRGASGVRRLLVGSTAEEVMRLAPVPVMVLPPAVEEGEGPELRGTRLESEPVGAGARG